MQDANAGSHDEHPHPAELLAALGRPVGSSPGALNESSPEAVVHPSRVLRLAAMAQTLLIQIDHIELDKAGRRRLATVFNHTVEALREVLSEDLQTEIDQLELRVPDKPTDAELRIAQAQLVGWLEGLFHGIRTTLIAHELATQDELARAYQHGLDAAHEQTEQRAASSYL
jgi:hypothetical protein